MAFKSLLGAVVLFTISTVANGSLVERDWQTVGDRALTYDTTTGLQWLDLTASSGQSVNEVLAQLGAGGTYDGFQYASENEVRTLFSNAGIPDLSGEWNSLNYQPVLDLQTLIGVTRSSFGESFGATSDQGSSSLLVRAIGLQEQSNPLSSVFEQGRVFTTTVDYDRTAFLGHWLIKPVPIPSAVWLFGSGLIGLIGLARRKANA